MFTNCIFLEGLLRRTQNLQIIMESNLVTRKGDAVDGIRVRRKSIVEMWI